MLRLVDDGIESPYKIIIVPDIFHIFFKSCERFCITLLTPHGGRHGACCMTSHGLHLSATLLLRAHMTSQTHGAPARVSASCSLVKIQSVPASMTSLDNEKTLTFGGRYLYLPPIFYLLI